MNLSELIGWNHPVDEGDQWEGFNDAGIYHFAGSPIQHLAREVHQNSLDAGEKDLVEVHIKQHHVKTCEIPGFEEYKQVMQSCYKESVNEGGRAELFFKAAVGLLEKDKIPVLEISDYNTTGMKGPAENGTPFYAFMKAKGQSKKPDGSTGSFGIGKSAPYAVSKLRTIFVSTVYEGDDGSLQQLTQGKSLLMSHDRDGSRRQGVGFWGIKDKCKPVDGDNNLIPRWIQRAGRNGDAIQKGSTLTVLGFEGPSNWQEILAVSVAENFFAAISDGKLRVVIGENKIVLDQNSIYEFFESEEIRKSIKGIVNEPEHFDNCRSYLAAHQGGLEVIREESQQTHLGLCELKILIGENLPKKVCALRNGMFITDSLNGLKKFTDFKDFVAVFHCQNKAGNNRLSAVWSGKTHRVTV